MLENLYTTKMSNDKEKLKTRLENIQKEPKKKHKAVGLLVFLALAAALTVGTFCLASTTAEDITMTDEEFAAYLDQPWGAVMATLDYADEEFLIFHYGNALFYVELGNYSILRIFDLSDLNLTTAAQGDVFLQVDVAQDRSKVYLSTGGMTDLAAEYDSYVIDLTTGQVEKGAIPEGTDLFRNWADTSTVIPGLAGWYSTRCVTVGDRTYYLNNGGSMVNQLQLVTHYADDRSDQVWYLFGEPGTVPDNTGDDLYTMTEKYLAREFHRVYDPYYDIQALTLSGWNQSGNEATFSYAMDYLRYNRDPGIVDYIESVKDDPELYETLYNDYLALQRSNYAFKIVWDGESLSLYYDISMKGPPEWTPTDIQGFVMVP